jgi:dTMP kinase
LITFEGPEGCGKSTQARQLAESLTAAGRSVRLTREPGGTAIAEQIRAVLLDPGNGAMRPRAELLLYLAARAQHTAEVIRPALAAGTLVLCDRYSDSTLAYQGYGHRLPLAAVTALNDFATGGLTPDLTVLIDLPVTIGLARKRGQEWNRLESQTLDFHERVRAGYRQLALATPRRYLVVEGERSVAEITAIIANRVAQLLCAG